MYQNGKEEISDYIELEMLMHYHGNLEFDWHSINTFHNLYNYQLEKALKEIQRVSKKVFMR